jgi:hypothetical protein
MCLAGCDVMASGLGGVWSILREPLTALSFAQMKEAAAAAGLPVATLSHLRQTSGGRSTSKAELADAIDGLFNALDEPGRDRAAVHMVSELIRRSSDESRGRLEELLERVGWHLVADEPVPTGLRLDVPLETLPDPVRDAVVKAVRRYRDRDFDGAMTSVVGIIDTLTEAIYTANGLPDHKKSSYQQRAIAAHKTLEAAFRARLRVEGPASSGQRCRRRAWRLPSELLGCSWGKLGRS